MDVQQAKKHKLPPKAGMQKLGLVSLEKITWKHSNPAVSKGAYRKAGRGILPHGSDRTRSNEHKLKERKLRFDFRKKIFTRRVLRHCNRFPRTVANIPSSEVPKAGMDRALSKLFR